MATLTDLRFENSYAGLHPAFYQRVEPTALPDPHLVAFNPDAASLLDLDPAEGANPDLPRYLGGRLPLPGSDPLAQAYAGHQFGVWVPQLGDGRAILLGEVRNQRGERWDLHLKGAGRTRFSRFGDGRSVLRSAIREYLGSEAVHGLGIPTTRALAIVGSPLAVQREQNETAATLLRLSPSHVRFGTFQFFAAQGETERVRELTGYVIRHHFPELDEHDAEPARSVALFGEVTRRTAELMARWTAAGFAHGVMNTDNMAVLGITLDYGPFGFLDDFDAHFICNHSDAEGRYAFDQQPAVGMWNCARLGEALMTLGAEPREPWQAALEGYWPAFARAYGATMRAKLGFTLEHETDAGLIRELLNVLQAGQTDYTGFFRRLASVSTEAPASGTDASAFPAPESPGLAAWLAGYAARLRLEASGDAERAGRMRQVNPKYVLRNWVAQEAIEQAQAGHFGLIEALRQVLTDPFAEHPGMERYAEPPSPEARALTVSCSS